jgi:GTPase
VFDTPGLVTKHEMKKHKLDETFISSCRHSIQHSNLIGVLHDVSNNWNRHYLNPIIISLLKEYEHIPSFLILNKIDKMRSKRALLDLIKTLTCNNIALAPENQLEQASEEKKKPEGWSKFSNVFMVSSLTGDGIGKVMDFIESNAVARPWEFKNNENTDQKPEELIEQFVRARLLDYLPQEIPYLLNVQLEYFSKENNKVFACVNITCPNERIERLVCGVSDGKLKQITDRITSDLIESFQSPVTLTISTISLKKKNN